MSCWLNPAAVEPFAYPLPPAADNGDIVPVRVLQKCPDAVPPPSEGVAEVVRQCRFSVSCVHDRGTAKLGFRIAQRCQRKSCSTGIQHGFSRSALHIQRKVLILQP